MIGKIMSQISEVGVELIFFGVIEVKKKHAGSTYIFMGERDEQLSKLVYISVESKSQR